MTQTSIYDQHDKAFGQVQAHVISKDGEPYATIAFKMPPTGHGERRLWAYVHWIGEPMVRGCATGYGYDKRSAAASSAAAKLSKPKHTGYSPIDGQISEADAQHERSWISFYAALARAEGEHWNTRLERAGFTVWQAV